VLHKLVIFTLHILALRMAYFEGRTMQNSSFRGGRWQGSSSSRSSQGPIKTPPAPPLGSLLQQLTPEQFKSDGHDDSKRVEINEVKFLASFNWVESEIPTIVFPGRP
jgi:hypothetical protein